MKWFSRSASATRDATRLGFSAPTSVGPIRILLACAPKSGSTFVTTVVGQLPGFRIASFTPAYGRREQEIAPELIRQYSDGRCIAQHHVRASEWTIQCTEELELRPVVLVRNFYDAIVSLSDHVVRESVHFPMAYLDQRFAEIPEADRIDAIVDLAAPWLFNFYVSWWMYRPAAIVTYDEAVLTGVTGIRRVLDIAGVDSSDSAIETAIAAVAGMNTRLNRGISGRGAAILSGENKERLQHLAAYYPGVDFAPVGL